MNEPSERMKALIFQLLRRVQEIGTTLDVAGVTELGHALTPLYTAIAEMEHKLDLMTRERNGLQRRVADLESQRGGSPMRGWVE